MDLDPLAYSWFSSFCLLWNYCIHPWCANSSIKLFQATYCLSPFGGRKFTGVDVGMTGPRFWSSCYPEIYCAFHLFANRYAVLYWNIHVLWFKLGCCKVEDPKPLSLIYIDWWICEQFTYLIPCVYFVWLMDCGANSVTNLGVTLCVDRSECLHAGIVSMGIMTTHLDSEIKVLASVYNGIKLSTWEHEDFLSNNTTTSTGISFSTFSIIAVFCLSQVASVGSNCLTAN